MPRRLQSCNAARGTAAIASGRRARHEEQVKARTNRGQRGEVSEAKRPDNRLVHPDPLNDEARRRGQDEVRANNAAGGCPTLPHRNSSTAIGSRATAS